MPTTPINRDAETTPLREAARRLGISPLNAYELVRRGEFPVKPIRAGQRILIPTAALDRLLAGELVPAKAK
jgi:excisionase family DNA binding protein